MGHRGRDDGPVTAAVNPESEQQARRREQRAWYWYDWANSAYVTTTATVLFGPYLTVGRQARPPAGPCHSDDDLPDDLHVLGLPVAPARWPST